MMDNEISGGAGSALAAHSKDGSAPGQTAASTTTGATGQPVVKSETSNPLSDTTLEGVERVKASVRDVAASARETLSDQGGRAVDQIAGWVREQPLLALSLTGTFGLTVGLLLSRGRAW